MRVHVIDKARMLAKRFVTVSAGVLDKMAHAMCLVHLFRSTGVITSMAWEYRLHLVFFEVMPGDLTGSSFDGFLTNLALP